MKEIGSCFEEIENNSFNNILEENSRLLLFRAARDTLFQIGLIAKKRNIEKVFLPSYCCTSMIMPFQKLGFSIHFYRITRNLEIDYDFFISTVKDDSVVIVMNYFGRKAYCDYSSLFSQFNNVITVQDCTQHIFDYGLYDDQFDYQIGSIRKWLPIPDGAFLKINCSLDNINVEYAGQDKEFVDISVQILKEKKQYLEHNDMSLKKSFRGKYEVARVMLSNRIGLYSISDVSRKIIENDLDFKKICEDRDNNYFYLASKFDNAYPEQSAYHKKHKAPLCFPIFIENRDIVQQELAKEGIYCQVIWPICEEASWISEDSSWLSSHILAIPIDQRYTVSDMNYIYNNLRDKIGANI